MHCYFMLTYSVHQKNPTNQRCEHYADFVRNEIAEFRNEWNKVENIETTFTGILTVTGVTDAERKADARKQVRAKISPILKKVPEVYMPTVNIALMLEDNGNFIEFEA